MLMLFGLIVFGLYVFYNQQLENAAREAARFASVNSSSSQCPVVSRLDPILSNKYESYYRCDPPERGWPDMTAAARSHVWGMNNNQVSVAACWSGFVDPLGNADALPNPPNTFSDCTIGGINPKSNPNGIACPAPATTPGSTPYKADGDDKASSIAAKDATQYPTTVSVYACFNWTPPLSGVLFVPATITLRAVVTEALQRQQ
jgi:hypothetical protein